MPTTVYTNKTGFVKLYVATTQTVKCIIFWKVRSLKYVLSVSLFCVNFITPPKFSFSLACSSSAGYYELQQEGETCQGDS